MTDSLGARLAIHGGLSPSRPSADAARRSDWPSLSVDVLLDDGQGCVAAGGGEVGRRPEVATHAGPHTRAGEFAPYRVGGVALRRWARTDIANVGGSATSSWTWSV